VTTNPVIFTREFDPQVFLSAFAQALPAPPNPRFSDLAISKAILQRARTAKTPALRKYYQNLRASFIASYTSAYAAEQKAGIIQLLIDMESDPDLSDRRWAAYMLVTTYHETAKHMTSDWVEDPGVLRTYWPKNSTLPIAVPNIAYFKKLYAGKLGNAPLPSPPNPPDYFTYRGRGYIQLTGKINYEYFGYADNPDEVLNPAIDYKIMSEWMINGDNPSNAHPLEYYIHDNTADYFDARTMINGDKNKVAKGNTISNGQLIAGYAQAFDTLLIESLDYVPYYPGADSS
jgi:putative chitinase